MAITLNLTYAKIYYLLCNTEVFFYRLSVRLYSLVSGQRQITTNDDRNIYSNYLQKDFYLLPGILQTIALKPEMALPSRI